MVDIAQLVSASDCGSEGRGFESHYPPHKKYRYPFGYRYFLLGRCWIRRARLTRRVSKKVSGGHFFSAGENPSSSERSLQDCGRGCFLLRLPHLQPVRLLASVHFICPPPHLQCHPERADASRRIYALMLPEILILVRRSLDSILFRSG